MEAIGKAFATAVPAYAAGMFLFPNLNLEIMGRLYSASLGYAIAAGGASLLGDLIFDNLVAQTRFTEVLGGLSKPILAGGATAGVLFLSGQDRFQSASRDPLTAFGIGALSKFVGDYGYENVLQPALGL